MKNLIFAFCFLLIDCRFVLPEHKRYTIDKSGIKSRTGCMIENMSISQYNRDTSYTSDIRPKDRNEVTRYCCWLNKDYKGSNYISFSKPTLSYRWYLCKPDMSILENDSLNSLTLKEKLAYLEEKEKRALVDKNYLHKDSFPFIIQKEYVYKVFGLCNVEGSYYFCLDSNNKLIVQYQDRGPW